VFRCATSKKPRATPILVRRCATTAAANPSTGTRPTSCPRSSPTPPADSSRRSVRASDRQHRTPQPERERELHRQRTVDRHHLGAGSLIDLSGRARSRIWDSPRPDHPMRRSAPRWTAHVLGDRRSLGHGPVGAWPSPVSTHCRSCGSAERTSAPNRVPAADFGTTERHEWTQS
jgi:hypothetical protein